ncbi:hypothetical protein [uncultured Flavobacterium sp.]|uniref:hypothetical protein n=1 Tax=uncultured Flavobacterium sp. TaxID=165435 RepID=UPI00259A2DD5|nr:hypothetical protein [uncultured Flavobacterium sp.]
MKQFYFFIKPDKERLESKKAGFIGFSLRAWFTVPGDLSDKPFKELDKIDFWYNRYSKENFDFDIYTGVDSSTVHFCDNERDFLAIYEKDGYVMISEKNYLRYRKLAINGLSKFSEQGDQDGEERYFYSNRTGRYFNEALLCKIRYKEDSYPFNVKNDFLQTNYVYDFKIVEANKIFLSKEDKYLCNNFNSTAFKNVLFYKSWEEAISGAFRKDDDTVEISHFQYTRLRNLLKAMMIKKSPLELLKFNKPQDYYLRHRD